jgi:amino acid permease
MKNGMKLEIEVASNADKYYSLKPTPSDLELFAVSVKLFIGMSYLSMPNTLAQCGIIGGNLLFAFVTGINGITMWQTLKLGQAFPGVRSFSDLGERIYGLTGRIIVDLSILVNQVCTCISYLYFVASQLDFIACQLAAVCLGNQFNMLLLMFPVILMSMAGSYKFLGALSVPSLVIALVGMMVMLVNSFYLAARGEIEGHSSSLEYFDTIKMLGRIGLAMYIFDANAIILSVSYEANEKRVYYPKVLMWSLAFSLAVFTLFATICYYVYRDQAEPIFTMSLVPLNAINVFILACISFNALTSYPLQILTAFDVVERFFKVDPDS